ncbi:MAG: DivIVA domain-containing protein [Actinoallomurus sp.]
MTEQPPLEDFFSNQAFDVVMRGYARNQVDDYVAQIESSVRQLREHNTEMQTALESTEKRATEQDKPSYAGLGSRVEQLLRLAEEESTDLVHRARTEAEKLREQIVGKAQRDAEGAEERQRKQEAELTAEVGRRRDELDQEVEERRRKSVEDADTRKRTSIEEAEARKKSVLEEAERVERESTQAAEQRKRSSVEEADKRVTDAKQKAEQLVRLAQEDADRIRSDADAHAARTREQTEREMGELDRKKTAVNNQMEQLRNLLGVAAPLDFATPSPSSGAPAGGDQGRGQQQATPPQGQAQGQGPRGNQGGQGGSQGGQGGGQGGQGGGWNGPGTPGGQSRPVSQGSSGQHR